MSEINQSVDSNHQRRQAAERAFQAFDFGPQWTVKDTGGWEMGSCVFQRSVFLEPAEGAAETSTKVVFRVGFTHPFEGAEVNRAEVLDGESGARVGDIYQLFNVIAMAESSGQIVCDQVLAKNAQHAFRVSALQRKDTADDFVYIVATPANTELTFAGESGVYETTILEQTDVFC